MKFNIWRHEPSYIGPTGGWVFIGEVRAETESQALSIAARALNVDRSALRAYVHIDCITEAA